MHEHGGQVRAAAARYGIPVDQWLDLSTGINPHGWPVPPVPAAAWARLPQDDDGLEAAARDYYRAPQALPVAGSQAAIQALPRLRAPGRVVVLAPGYCEHAAAWARAGHTPVPVAPDELADPAELAARAEVVVLTQPNNPTGHHWPPQTLLALHDQLAARGGWLVVDEAFADATPRISLAARSQRPGLVVLRSLGKFFGLAGARVGFVLAAPTLLDRLRDALGPWPLAGPSRHIATAALADRAWQRATRARLAQDCARLVALLTRHGLRPAGGTALFQWIPTAQAPGLHVALARHGVLTRLFENPPGLRFGLPGDAAAWQRLDAALAACARPADAHP